MKSRSQRYNTNMKSRSQRYNINRPRLRNGHEYNKYKVCLSILMVRRPLSNI